MHPVFEALSRHARTRADVTAFRHADRHITWAGLADAITHAAKAFAAGPRTVGLHLSGIDYVIGMGTL